MKNRNNKIRKRRLWLFAVAAGAAAFLCFWLWPRPLQTAHYMIRTEITSPIRVVQLTDLHGREFGENNEKLTSLVSAQQPDLIFMTGDMFSRDETDLSRIFRLISSMSEIAPVYYSYGNHETDWMETKDTDLKSLLTQAGACVLDDAYKDIDVNGQEVRIGGYSGFYRTPHMDTLDPELQAEKLAFADDFEDTNRQKLLLAHIPTGWLDWGRINLHEAGIVFSGHNHGGQIRIPIINRGVFAPYVGFFPRYVRGMFYGEKAICILSAGLGSGHRVPRINNPPEIVVADLLPREETD